MALPESSPKEGAPKKPTDQDDKDFDPTPEALIDEIDDERTLEEEEALDGVTGTAVQEELDDLKKESEMPIEELLAYYERMRNEAQDSNSDREEEEEEDEDEDEELEEEEEEDEGDRSGSKQNQSCSGRCGNKRGNEDDEDGEDGGGASKKRHSASKYPSTEPSGNKSLADSTSHQQGTTSEANSSKQHQDSDCKAANNRQDLNTASNSNVVESNSSLADNSSAKQTSKPDSTHDAPNDQPESHSGCDDEQENERQRPRHPMTDFIVDDENGDMFDSLFGYDLDDSDDDYSYTDGENDDERNWRRVIHVGPDYQAEVPEGLNQYDYSPPYENDDKLVWKWNVCLTQETVLDYLKQASALSKKKDVSISPSSVPKISYDKMRLYHEKMLDLASNTVASSTENNYEHSTLNTVDDIYISQSRKRARIDHKLEQENSLDRANQASSVEQQQVLSSRDENIASDDVVKPDLPTEDYFQDEEQLLYLLLQCNHNIEEAIRRRKLAPLKYFLYEPMSLWSEDECLGFEHGLKMYGKNFRLIRENKVPTRTYAEVVAFYYLWKKSERHDVYTNQYKLDRKRCLSHPGTTDYMDKFIEDNESNLNATSSTCTPTPTESNEGLQSNLKVVRENSLPFTSCETTDAQSATVQHINLSPESTTQRYHLQLHHPQKAESCLGDK